MEWQTIVLALQILIIAVGWAIFQKARADLSAQAAQTPVLGEIKALHRNVRALVQEIEQAGTQTSARLERQCEEARELLTRLESQRQALMSSHDAACHSRQETMQQGSMPGIDSNLPVFVAESQMPEGSNDSTSRDSRYNDLQNQAEIQHTRREAVYERADAGAIPAQIARETGLSEGEVETLLGLRARR